MEQIKNSAVRFGIWPPTPLPTPPPPPITLHNDDWTSVQKVPFSPAFPAPQPGSPKGVPRAISVIVTPILSAGIVPVPVVVDVASDGFSFRARNTDPGSTDIKGLSFSWLAVLNTPDPKKSSFLDIRTAIAQPKETSGFLTKAIWPRLWFSAPAPTAPAVLLTEISPRVAREATPALVGFAGQLANMSSASPADGISIKAVNVDTVGGRAGFNAVAIASFRRGEPALNTENMWLDHGSEQNADDYFAASLLPVPNAAPYPIERGGVTGDWVSLDIYFDRPFLTPPVVLATARRPLQASVSGTPIVPVVHNVTTHGFTLAARNTDSTSGYVGFYWVALGCNEGCS